MQRVSPRTLLIVNPASRAGANGRTFPKIEPKIREALGPLEIEWTQHRGHAADLVQKASSQIDRVLVAGGDGTAHEVASGLLASGEGARIELGLLPLGTGGDLMRTLELPRNLDGALERIRGGHSSPLDAARIRYRDPEGVDREGWLVNEISAGFAGLVASAVDRGGKWLGATGSFLVATLRAIISYPPMAARVTVDDAVVHEGDMVLATASNGRFFGGGMQVAPAARVDDGWLDCIVIPRLTRLELLRKLPTLYTGTHVEVPGVVATRGRRIEIEPVGAPVPFEVDGEALGRLPLRAEVVPDALKIVGAAR